MGAAEIEKVLSNLDLTEVEKYNLIKIKTD